MDKNCGRSLLSRRRKRKNKKTSRYCVRTSLVNSAGFIIRIFAMQTWGNNVSFLTAGMFWLPKPGQRVMFTLLGARLCLAHSVTGVWQWDQCSHQALRSCCVMSLISAGPAQVIKYKCECLLEQWLSWVRWRGSWSSLSEWYRCNNKRLIGSSCTVYYWWPLL